MFFGSCLSDSLLALYCDMISYIIVPVFNDFNVSDIVGLTLILEQWIDILITYLQERKVGKGCSIHVY